MSRQSATASVAHPERRVNRDMVQLTLLADAAPDDDDAPPDYTRVDALGRLLQQCADLDCRDGLHLPHPTRAMCQNCGLVLRPRDSMPAAERGG